MARSAVIGLPEYFLPPSNPNKRAKAGLNTTITSHHPPQIVSDIYLYSVFVEVKPHNRFFYLTYTSIHTQCRVQFIYYFFYLFVVSRRQSDFANKGI